MEVAFDEISSFIAYAQSIYTDPHFQRKIFQVLVLINIRGLAEIIVPFRGYGRNSPNHFMIKRE